MAKRILLLSLSLILILSLNVYGATKAKYVEKMLETLGRELKTPEESVISKYLITPEPEMFFPATGDTAGFTYWDHQYEGTPRRQIAWDPVGGLAHLTWTNLVGPDMINNRYVDYNSWDGSSWLAAGGIHVSPAISRAGYSGLDLLPDDREVLCYHREEPTIPNTYWGTAISIEKVTPGLGWFDAYDIPDSSAWEAAKGLSPVLACSKVPDSGWIHIVTITKNGNENDFRYVRCYEDPTRNDTLVCMSPGWGGPIYIKANTKLVPNKVPYRIATSASRSVFVATSPVSEKVCITYLQNWAPAGGRNEVYYAESTNNGHDWMDAHGMTPVKITDYQPTDTRAYPGVVAYYDLQDKLHIAWRTFSKDMKESAIWHWDSYNHIRKVKGTDSWWLDWAGGGLKVVDIICKVGGTLSTIGLLLAEAGWLPAWFYLYLLYVNYSSNDMATNGNLNGDVCLKGSTNGGLTWGPEINLTNTNTNGCTPGNCLSEVYPSIAENADDSLYIMYIEDKDAGCAVCDPCIQETFTNNAVRLLKIAAPEVPAAAQIDYTPTQMIKPVRWATNGGSTGKTMYFDNVGTATLYVKVSDPAPGTYLTITNGNFNIIEAGPTHTVGITFNGAGLQDTFIIDSLMIASNDGLVGGAETYIDTQWVKYHFVVTTNYYYAEFDTAIFANFKATVSNTGNIGNQEDEGMFWNGHNYVFESTPAFATSDIDGSGPVGFTWLHEHHDFLAEDSLIRHDYPALDLVVFKDKFALIFPPRRADHYIYHQWWGYWTKWSLIAVAPSHVIWVWNWWMWNAPPVWWDDIFGPTDPQGGYFGIAVDWDVPAEASARNLGGYDDTLNVVWQYSDSAGYEDYYGGFLWLSASVDGTPETEPLGAHVLTNPTQLYPFGGYDDDSLYKYMSLPGYSIESDSSQDMNIVMSFVEKLNPTDNTVIAMKYALVISDQGESGFYNQVKKAKGYNPSDGGRLTRSGIRSGDANADGAISISDVVYLINFLFKGGPPPWCKAYSDPNGDKTISVSDVVHLINYLFKGGPAPVLVWYEEPPW